MGKTYAMSDIHGMLKKFNAMIKMLNLQEDDRVYILGDVVDRGPESLKILDIIRNDQRFEMLMGNHEHMMLCSLTQDADGARIYGWNSRKSWMRNGGKETLDQFKDLDFKEKEELISYLKSLPLVIPNLKVGERVFHLVHALAHPWEHQDDSEYIFYKDVKGNVDGVITNLWDRPTEVGAFIIETMETLRDKGIMVICGHTPTLLISGEAEIYHDEENRFIDIDCGAAYSGRLACICLDDMSEYYV